MDRNRSIEEPGRSQQVFPGKVKVLADKYKSEGAKTVVGKSDGS